MTNDKHDTLFFFYTFVLQPSLSDSTTKTSVIHRHIMTLQFIFSPYVLYYDIFSRE